MSKITKCPECNIGTLYIDKTKKTGEILTVKCIICKQKFTYPELKKIK